MASATFEHRIHLFYDFTFVSRSAGPKLSKLKLGAVAPPEWIHASRIEGTPQRPIADKPVWEWSDWDISLDLHPFVHEILDSSGTHPKRPQCLRLSTYGKNLVLGRYRNAVSTPGERGSKPPPDGFLLKLSALSTVAVGEAALPLVIDDVSVHVFGTGFGVAVVTLHAARGDAALTHAALVEALPRLCDERGERFLRWRSDGADPDPTAFSLGSAIAPIIEPAGCSLTRRERTYSFCALVFDDKLPEPEKRDLAFRLSRHYNARYRPSPDLAGTFYACPFETVVHAMSREGVSTIVDYVTDENQKTEFIGTWLAQAHARVYLPLQVAAYHEHVVLLDLAQGAGRPIDAVRSGVSDTAALRKLGARFLLFRLRYRLSQVSRLTTHDLAYAATERALGLTALSEKIGRDLLAVERRLIDIATEKAEAAAKRVERRWALPLSIGSAALTYVSLNSSVMTLERVFFRSQVPVNDGSVAGRSSAPGHASVPSHAFAFTPELVIQPVIILLAILAFVYTWTRQRAGISDMDRIAEHEAAEASIAAGEQEESVLLP